MKRGALCLAFAAALLATDSAVACNGKNVLFWDNFAAVNSGWALYDKDTAKISGGSLKLTPEPTRRAFIIYRADLYEKANVCVDAALREGTAEPAAAAVGLIFAWEDYVGFYYFWVSPGNGTAGVSRWSDSARKWLEPVSPRKLEEINTTAGAKNSLRLTIDGAHVAAYVNDRPFVEIKIKAPELGGFIGLEADAPAAATFENFMITDLP
jgi:hypothetical protein